MFVQTAGGHDFEFSDLVGGRWHFPRRRRRRRLADYRIQNTVPTKTTTWIPPLEHADPWYPRRRPPLGRHLALANQLSPKPLGGKGRKIRGGLVCRPGRIQRHRMGGETLALNALASGSGHRTAQGAEGCRRIRFCANAALLYDESNSGRSSPPRVYARFHRRADPHPRQRAWVPDHVSLKSASACLAPPLTTRKSPTNIADFLKKREIMMFATGLKASPRSTCISRGSTARTKYVSSLIFPAIARGKASARDEFARQEYFPLPDASFTNLYRRWAMRRC